ncbi:MAG: hypothetical protein EOP82_08155 [Variovorax sp.]|nr:MAG: hypothetical protein EOP82_08155 [Variovorax sp.]
MSMTNLRTTAVDELLSFLSGWRRVHHSRKMRFDPRASAGAGFGTSAHGLERFPRVANDADVQSADSLLWSIMSTYVYRFVGLETLPARLTDFDLQQFFQLGTGDVEAIRQRFNGSDPTAGSQARCSCCSCAFAAARWTSAPCCRATSGTWPKRCKHLR